MVAGRSVRGIPHSSTAPGGRPRRANEIPLMYAPGLVAASSTSGFRMANVMSGGRLHAQGDFRSKMSAADRFKMNTSIKNIAAANYRTNRV